MSSWNMNIYLPTFHVGTLNNIFMSLLERVRGIGPLTSTLEKWHSTSELHPLKLDYYTILEIWFFTYFMSLYLQFRKVRPCRFKGGDRKDDIKGGAKTPCYTSKVSS